MSTSAWFPVGEQYEAVLLQWLEARKAAGATDEDPLFPKTPSAIASKANVADCNLPWASTTLIRHIFRDASAAAGLPYFNPHSVRNTLTQLRREICRTDEEKKAWSQNLGHKHERTTEESYGHVASERQHELLAGLWSRSKERLVDPEVLDLRRDATPEEQAAVKILPWRVEVP